jgi:D-lactate dehydrogenase (cytochrome)
MASVDELVAALTSALGMGGIVLDLEERRAVSADVYSRGATCAALLKPRDKHALAVAVGTCTRLGYAVLPRGGGLTYTGGYTPPHEHSVVLDTTGLNRIVEIAEEDMYVTVEAGVTWKQLYEALAPRGLRLPFFGTFSGSGATVGSGVANGALFFGTARYGTAADCTLGLEVALADGTLVKTGQAAFGGKPFYRTYGPDLTGLFTHDSGALGVKVEVTFRLMRTPAHTGFASFAFAGVEAASAALAEVSRSGVAEEAYLFDPDSTRKNLGGVDFAQGLEMLGKVVRGQSGLLKGLKAGARLALAGRHFADDVYSLHAVCAARNAPALEADLAACRAIATGLGGAVLPDSIPRACRADPFPPMNGVLGTEGDRWAALNAKVAHSAAPALIRDAEALLDGHAAEMEAHGIWMSRLMIAMSTHAFSYEPVFHWNDEWLPIHRRAPEPAYLARLSEPAANPVAREVVHRIRGEMLALFARHGAASNQIARTYPYLDSMAPSTRRMLEAIKRAVDPACLLNPGSLGLG